MLHFWRKVRFCVMTVNTCEPLGLICLQLTVIVCGDCGSSWQGATDHFVISALSYFSYFPNILTSSMFCEVICRFVFFLVVIWFGIKVILASLNELEIVSSFFCFLSLWYYNFFNWHGGIKMFSFVFSQFW